MNPWVKALIVVFCSLAFLFGLGYGIIFLDHFFVLHRECQWPVVVALALVCLVAMIRFTLFANE